MELFQFLILLLPFLYLLFPFYHGKLRNYPPSPSISLPFIGHLHLLKKPLHRTLAQISNKYGPILLLQFGSRRVLLVSSPSAAEECLTKNDIVFANRPRLLAGEHLGYNYTTLVWASYGDHWRNLRRIASLEILSAHRIHTFADVHRSEIQSLLKRLMRNEIVDMKLAFFEMMINILMRMIGGKRYYGDDLGNLEESRRLKDIVTETFRLSGATNIGNFLPVLRWIGIDKLGKKLEALQMKRDNWMRDLIEEHRKMTDSEGKKKENTLINVLLSLQETDPQCYTNEVIRGLMQVMISAGTDTSVATLEWALSLLLNNLQTLIKAQNEIDNKIGNSRLVDESDLPHLPYLHGIINETLRMYPAGPMLVPHESSSKCTVGGHQVPRGTMLLVNLWAIQNDPELWDEPRKFRPERFIAVEERRDRFILMPFGYGRRGCPGENLAMQVVGLALASIIQCFEWARVGEEMVDMSEGEGLTMPKALPLVAKCRARPCMVKLLSQTLSM